MAYSNNDIAKIGFSKLKVNYFQNKLSNARDIQNIIRILAFEYQQLQNPSYENPIGTTF